MAAEHTIFKGAHSTVTAASLATLKRVLQLSPDAMLLIDQKGSIALAHRATYLSAPHSRPMGIGLDLVGRRRDGSEFPIDISLRPFSINRRPIIGVRLILIPVALSRFSQILS